MSAAQQRQAERAGQRAVIPVACSGLNVMSSRYGLAIMAPHTRTMPGSAVAVVWAHDHSTPPYAIQGMCGPI